MTHAQLFKPPGIVAGGSAGRSPALPLRRLGEPADQRPRSLSGGCGKGATGVAANCAKTGNNDEICNGNVPLRGSHIGRAHTGRRCATGQRIRPLMQ